MAARVALTAAAVVATASATLTPGFITYDQVKGSPYKVGYTERAFTINDTPTLLLGGAVHPPRLARGDWEPLLQRARGDGLNHVQIYVFWNFHEQVKGQVDFTAGTRRDLGGFLQAAGDAGLFVNVRLGPYVCAEWDGGGLPLWLRQEHNLTCCRCNQGAWETEMTRWIKVVGAVIEPHLAKHGGPVVLAQIENELHSQPSDPYVTYCGALAEAMGWDIPWVMCNGASANNTVNTCNGNTCGADGAYADTHASHFPGQPMGWTEDWSWFSTWGAAVTNHPGPFMADNIAAWFAKGGAHHVYYMWYGGNHIEHWAASGLTNRYGDGSNLHSDTLPNEPKRSHLAAMHAALAAMAPALVAAPVQTRADAVAVVPCPPSVAPRQPLCVNGTNGTGNVACEATDPQQRFTYSGGVNKTGTIAFGGLCVSGACPGMTNVSGCAPLPLVPCNPNDLAQQWTLVVTPGSTPDDALEARDDHNTETADWPTRYGDGSLDVSPAPKSMRMINGANRGCLSGWSKHATPGVSAAVPFTGVAACATGWGTSVMDWDPFTQPPLLINSASGGASGAKCLSATHPVTAPVIAYEYRSSNPTAAVASFVVNTGDDSHVTLNGTTFFMQGGSTTFLLADSGSAPPKVLFNTHAVAAEGIPCNRSYTPLPGATNLAGWSMWSEPIPGSSGSVTHHPTPIEQLNLTLDQTEYLFYTAEMPMSDPNSDAMVNLTISTVQASTFTAFLDGVYAGTVEDHTKGPDPVTLTLPLPAATRPQTLLLLSGSLGIQNFHGACPTDFRKGIVGSIKFGSVDFTAPPEGWYHRPYLEGELRNASAANSSVPWTPLSESGGLGRPLTWFRATFADPRPHLPPPASGNGSLLLDATKLTRGHFYVNGHDLGRFWTLGGLETHYYIPQDVLAPAGQTNTLVIFDELGVFPAAVASSVKLVLGTLVLPQPGMACPV